MSKKDLIEIPSKGVWRALNEIKNSDIRHLRISNGENTTIVDSPIGFNLRIIPRVFTVPFQAIGLVSSIFARMTNTKITLQVKNDND